MPDLTSTGRGGAGNIGKDETVYTDGAIVREGIEGASSTDAEYSTGRGGAGNISDPTGTHTSHHHPHPPAEAAKRTDDEYVPEPAFRTDAPTDYHTGRGGAGNEHVAKFGGHSSKHEQDHAGESIVEKAKHMLGLDKKKE